MITRRDAQVIDWLDGFKAAHTSTLCELFYPSYGVACNRLNAIVEAGELSRERDGWCGEYIYYKKRPKQIRHAVLLTDFYRELSKRTDVKKFIPEPMLNNIRPDAVCGFNLNGENRLALIEVEISHKGFDTEKYQRFSWQSHFPIQPELIAICDKPVSVPGYIVSTIGTDLNLKGVLSC